MAVTDEGWSAIPRPTSATYAGRHEGNSAQLHLEDVPAQSNTELLADEVIANLESNGVECETVRLVDLNILPG